MAQRRHRGGRPRGEAKKMQFWDCALCHKQVSRRKSKDIGWYKGQRLRVCRHHPVDVKA